MIIIFETYKLKLTINTMHIKRTIRHRFTTSANLNFASVTFFFFFFPIYFVFFCSPLFIFHRVAKLWACEVGRDIVVCWIVVLVAEVLFGTWEIETSSSPSSSSLYLSSGSVQRSGEESSRFGTWEESRGKWRKLWQKLGAFGFPRKLRQRSPTSLRTSLYVLTKFNMLTLSLCAIHFLLAIFVFLVIAILVFT